MKKGKNIVLHFVTSMDYFVLLYVTIIKNEGFHQLSRLVRIL